ncbi:hypothetical protein LI328DRAFT_76134 [Trichoderma asperelloides]|nr:hypothetical protein LI328DRAFT_76134 [Trichoderma asperelloides]
MGQNRLRSAGGVGKGRLWGRGLPVSLTLFLLFYCLKNSNLLDEESSLFFFFFSGYHTLLFKDLFYLFVLIAFNFSSGLCHLFFIFLLLMLVQPKVWGEGGLGMTKRRIQISRYLDA